LSPNQWWRSIHHQLDDQNLEWKLSITLCMATKNKFGHHTISNGKFSVTTRLVMKKFWSSQDWQLIIFKCHMNGNQKVLVANSTLIEIFWLPILWWLNAFSIAIRNVKNPGVMKKFLAAILMNVTNVWGWTLMWQPTQNGHIILVLITLKYGSNVSNFFAFITKRSDIVER